MTEDALPVFELSQLLNERGMQPQYAKDMEELPEHTVVRERFANRGEFVLTFVAYVFSPVNIIRFPYLVVKNGGAVFTWLYLAAVVVVGLPVSYLELALGQYSGKNSVRVWDLSPAFRGELVVCWLAALHFQLVMAHCILYAATSVGHNYPGFACKPTWDNCFSKYSDLGNWTERRNVTLCREDRPVTPRCLCHRDIQQGCRPAPLSSTLLYHHEQILQITQDSVEVQGFGAPSWRMALILLCCWALLILCMLRGNRYITKFMYVTVLLPFLGLVVLMVKSATDTGAIDGLKYLFAGDFQWSQLRSSQIWMDAVSQALFSMNALLGELFIVGSYCNFRCSHLHWDVMTVTAVDVLSSVLVALTLCLAMGHSAHLAGPDYTIRDILSQDTGFSLVTFITAVVRFPFPHLAAAVLFILLFTVSIDAMFGLVETILTYLQDDFRAIRRNSVKTRVVFGIVSYLANIILTCPGGDALMLVIDEAAFSVCIPLLALIEVCVIMWGYGVRQFLADLEYMLAVPLRAYYLWICHYAICIPVVLLALFVGSIVDHFQGMAGNTGVKAGVMAFVLFPVPVWLVLYLARIYRSHRLMTCASACSKLLDPLSEWGPNDGSNIHRSLNSVFADLFDRFKAKPSWVKRVSQDSEFPLSCNENDGAKWEVDRWFEDLFLEGPETSATSGDKRRSVSMAEKGPKNDRRTTQRRHTLL